MINAMLDAAPFSRNVHLIQSFLINNIEWIVFKLLDECEGRKRIR